MSAVNERTSYSEFELFCNVNDIEFGDTLVFQKTVKSSGETSEVLGIFVGEGKNGAIECLLETGKKVLVNQDLLKAVTRASTFRVVGKSLKSLKLKDIKGA